MSITFRQTAISTACLLFAAGASFAAEDRDAKVRTDRTDVQATGAWVYNDLAKGVEAAARSKRPLLVVLRCVP